MGAFAQLQKSLVNLGKNAQKQAKMGPIFFQPSHIACLILTFVTIFMFKLFHFGTLQPLFYRHFEEISPEIRVLKLP